MKKEDKKALSALFSSKPIQWSPTIECRNKANMERDERLSWVKKHESLKIPQGTPTKIKPKVFSSRTGMLAYRGIWSGKRKPSNLDDAKKAIPCAKKLCFSDSEKSDSTKVKNEKSAEQKTVEVKLDDSGISLSNEDAIKNVDDF